jgi:hypothetical protein
MRGLALTILLLLILALAGLEAAALRLAPAASPIETSRAIAASQWVR